MYTLPFRHAPVLEVCTRCREPAIGRCKRCGGPLCASHLPPKHERCADCEMVFHGDVDRPLTTLLPLGAWIAVAPIVGGVLLRHDPLPFAVVLNLFLGTLFIAPFITAGLRAIYVLTKRLYFLRQHSLMANIPVTYCEQSWFEMGESWSRPRPAASTIGAASHELEPTLSPRYLRALFSPRV